MCTFGRCLLSRKTHRFFHLQKTQQQPQQQQQQRFLQQQERKWGDGWIRTNTTNQSVAHLCDENQRYQARQHDGDGSGDDKEFHSEGNYYLEMKKMRSTTKRT